VDLLRSAERADQLATPEGSPDAKG